MLPDERDVSYPPPLDAIHRNGTPSEALPREQDRLQLAAQATQALIWDWDIVQGTVAWAGATHGFFSAPPDEGPVRPGEDHGLWAERVHPEDLAFTRASARAALASRADSWVHEYRFRRADGSYAHVLERAFIIRGADGGAVRVVGAIQDISERQVAEDATRRLAAIVTSATDAIVGKTVDGIVTSWNAAAERVFGYTAEEMIGQSIFKLIPEEHQDAERVLLDCIRRGERVEFPDTVRVRKDGTPISVSVTVSPIRDAAGRVVGASSIKRDITERKRATDELARREERYRALVQATTSIVWTADPVGRFTEPQASWEQYTGQRWEEHRDLGWLDALHPDDRDHLMATWTQALDRRSIYEMRGRLWCRPHQAYRHFVARAAPVIGSDGTLREWIGTVTDVEDRWMTEERLRQVERMESVGRLAGGIAHEANNQMTVILGASEFLLHQLHDERMREDVEHIRRAAQRTAAITQQLLAYSRRQVLQPQIVDLNAIVTRLEPVLQRVVGETSQVVHRLAPDLGRVKADPGQLDQVLLNLALNARDAMPAGGVLTIETANVMLDETYGIGKAVATVTPGMYAMLMVSDTGVGMDDATLSHLFEPFFTTKGVGEGTGLGLATVYGVVKQSGGFIWVYSEPGHGAAFKIYLPLVTQAAEPPVLPPRPAVPGGTEVILLVEDNRSVRDVLARSLRERGYTVLEAEDGTDALKLAEQRASPPDLVIADVVMPRMNGRELQSRLRERWPELPVLFVSGYTGLDAVSRGLVEHDRDFLQKPLEPDALGREVRRILDAGKPGPAGHGRRTGGR